MSIKNSILILTLIILATFPKNADAFEFKLGGKFFDYGNGAINLDNVTHIKHKLKYTITFPEDSEEDILRAYGPSASRNNVDDTLGFLNVTTLAEMDFYYIKIASSVYFDNFELTILEEKIFLKIPKDLPALKEVSTRYPLVIKFVDKVAADLGLPVSNAEEYEALISAVPEFSTEAYSQIEKDLEYTLETYRTVVK